MPYFEKGRGVMGTALERYTVRLELISLARDKCGLLSNGHSARENLCCPGCSSQIQSHFFLKDMFN